MTYEARTVLHADEDTDSGLQRAKEYIAAHKLTYDDVKIVRRGDSLCVVCKRGVEI